MMFKSEASCSEQWRWFFYPYQTVMIDSYNCLKSSLYRAMKTEFKTSQERFYHDNYNWTAIWQNQQNVLCAQRNSDQPGHPPSLIRVVAVCMKKPWALNYPSYPMSALQRLGRSPGWSESLLGAQVILLVLSCAGSIITYTAIMRIRMRTNRLWQTV